ncbi:DsbA family protein [Streptomyces olivoreticuli]|uniref:DsbA family protein n=1 Tax=Streptomyces olivoreticuli TaxID=68246 RepID=UPI000E280CA8|nr:DsbA family protein [Streptomyces olivoreticuli]
MPKNTQPTTPRRQPHSRRRPLLAAIALVGALAASGGAIALTNDGQETGRDVTSSSDSPAKQAPADDALTKLARRDSTDPMAIGRTDAPVVMIEYSEFQCPFCSRFARETKPELLRSYVDQGLLRIEMRAFPIFGKESDQAALASYAAGRQKKFWQFHDMAFAKQRKKNSGEFSQENLEAMAKQAGVADIGQFRTDMASDEARKAVEKDKEEGYRLGVTSTPAFLINGRPLLGAQPTQIFKQAIEDAAKTAKTKGKNSE